MGYNLTPVDDRTFELVAQVYKKYGVHLSGTEARLLQLLIDLRCATMDRIDDEIWPDADPFEQNLRASRSVFIHKLRKKFGHLIEITTFARQGYTLNRLGPVENPMHERKTSGPS